MPPRTRTGLREVRCDRPEFRKRCGSPRPGCSTPTPSECPSGRGPRARAARLRRSTASVWGNPPAAGCSRSIPAGAGKPRRSAPVCRTGEVYPRRCGEAGHVLEPIVANEGLSPQVRGSPGRLPGRQLHRGSIPAGAGKPRALRAQGRALGVYPRRCGEAPAHLCRYFLISGLSPQVRGSRDDHDGRRLGSGSIPAGAGKPHRRKRQAAAIRVYPRRCGEANEHKLTGARGTGLSPQVRGSRYLLARRA